MHHIRISPHYKLSDLPSRLSLDDKIKVFEDMVFGWQLEIADQIINEKRDNQGKIIREPIPDSGYAVLSIVLSYFEMISKFQEGYCGENKSKEYFEKGVRSVFPELDRYNPRGVNMALDVLWKGVRCGLYHQSSTNKGIGLTASIKYPLVFNPRNFRLIINPHRLVPYLKKHFGDYISQLKNVKNKELRENFDQRFEYSRRAPNVKTGSTGS